MPKNNDFWHKKVKQAAQKRGLGRVLCINSPAEFPSIGSDALFLVKTSLGEFVFKFLADRQKLKERASYHKFMEQEQILPVSNLIALDLALGVMIFEYEQGETLLHKFFYNSPGCFEDFRESLLRLSKAWRITAPTRFRDRSRTLKELLSLKNSIMEFFKDKQNLPVIVNGQDSGLTISQMVNQTLSELHQAQRPNPPCLVHGDARLENVVLNPVKGPVFIDLSPGQDWVDDLATFSWQRDFRLIRFFLPPRVAGRRFFEIDFQVSSSSSWAGRVEKLTLEVGAETARRDSGWLSRYYYTLTALALLHPVFVQQRREKGALGRDMPQNSEFFWAAEATRFFKIAQELS